MRQLRIIAVMALMALPISVIMALPRQGLLWLSQAILLVAIACGFYLIAHLVVALIDEGRRQ